MMNNPSNHPFYYYFPQNNNPNYLFTRQNQFQPLYRFPQYPNFPHYQPSFQYNPIMPTPNISIPRRPTFKNALNAATITVEDDEPIKNTSSDLCDNSNPDKIKGIKGKTLKISNMEYEYLQKKVCEHCRKCEHDELLLLCDYCDDAYHTYCLKPVLCEVPNEKEPWACPLCQTELDNIEYQKLRESNKLYVVLDPQYKRNIMEGFNMNNNPFLYRNWQMINPNPNQSQIEGCLRCNTPFLGEQFEVCFTCKKKFHSRCLNQNNDKGIICLTCEENVRKIIPANFHEYFEKPKTKFKDNLKFIHPRKKKRSGLYKTNTLFKLPISSSSTKVLEQKKNLYYYLKVRGVEFSDDLVYDNEKCSPSKNFSSLEPGLRELKKSNLDIIKEFKELSREANYAPVLIEEDKIQGFIVKAYEDIPKRTLICEYVGEVDYARNKIFDKTNDSIMMLLRTTRSKTSLVICPKNYANIAKFISGINNFDPNAKTKQNVNSVRFSIEDQARVFLYARRNIKAGEILYYDYNAGGLNEYPTLGFV